MTTELARVDPGYDGLVMVMSPAEAKRRLDELQAFVRSVMTAGTDYGVIPGTDKPTLLQPGAQKLCEIYGFAHTFEDAEKVLDWERGFFFFRKRTLLALRRDGRYVGDGFGSCNSKESRYAYRWAYDNEIPAGVDKKTLKSQTLESRKTGRPYTRYRLPNDDIASQVNTLEKMACKRSLVHAVIGATRSGGLFTQDAEDVPRDAFGVPEETRSWERGDAPAEAPSQGKGDPPISLDNCRSLILTATTEADLRKVALLISRTKMGGDDKLTLSAIYKARLAELASKKAAPHVERDPETGEAIPADAGE
jgi:hypothetical protein